MGKFIKQLKYDVKYIAARILESIEKRKARKREIESINCENIAKQCFQHKVLVVQTKKRYVLKYLKKNLDYTMSSTFKKTSSILQKAIIGDCLVVWIVEGGVHKLDNFDLFIFMLERFIGREIKYFTLHYKGE